MSNWIRVYQQWVINVKMFSAGGPKCPVRLFKLYLIKSPADLKASGRFYLYLKTVFKSSDDKWFYKSPIGKNSISKIIWALILGTVLEESDKLLTNHSMRKTTVKKLKAANVPESSKSR